MVLHTDADVIALFGRDAARVGLSVEDYFRHLVLANHHALCAVNGH